MAGLTGLTGLGASGPVTVAQDTPPEVIHGGPANPAHGAGLVEDPPWYPWIYQPGVSTADRSVSPELLGQPPIVAGAGTDPLAGMKAEQTGSHAAPWPAFSVADSVVNDRDQAAARQLANQDLHAADAGDAAAMFTMIPAVTQMPWEAEADYVTPGQSILQPVPGQLEGQMGRDRIQGTPALNEYGFDSAHVYRPRAVGDVPGNFLWLTGSQRPLVIRPAGRQTYPVGQDTPFAGQTPGTGSVDGAVLSGLPPAYSPPPGPPVDAGGPSGAGAGSPVWAAW